MIHKLMLYDEYSLTWQNLQRQQWQLMASTLSLWDESVDQVSEYICPDICDLPDFLKFWINVKRWYCTMNKIIPHGCIAEVYSVPYPFFVYLNTSTRQCGSTVRTSPITSCYQDLARRGIPGSEAQIAP